MALSDIEIAQQAKMQRVSKIAEKLGIPDEHLVPYGHYKAKVSLEYVEYQIQPFVDYYFQVDDGHLLILTEVSYF